MSTPELQKRREQLNAHLATIVTDQERELKELRLDRNRLDIVHDQKWSVQYNDYHHTWTVQRNDQVVGCIGKGPTMRAAIDDAIRWLAQQMKEAR